MKKEVADSLREALLDAVPQPGKNKYATGQLRDSIQEAVPFSTNSWVIIIGTSAAQTRKIPSNVYAAATNNSKTIRVFDSGKRENPRVPKFRSKNNPNYHWANNAIQKWVESNGYSLVTSIEEDNEDE